MDCFALEVDGAKPQDQDPLGSYTCLFRSPIPRLNLEVAALPRGLKVLILVKKLKVDTSKPIRIHLRYTQPHFRVKEEALGYYLPIIEPLMPTGDDRARAEKGEYRIKVFSKDSSISVGPEESLSVVSSSDREVLIEAEHMQLISFEKRAKRPDGASAKAPSSSTEPDGRRS